METQAVYGETQLDHHDRIAGMIEDLASDSAAIGELDHTAAKRLLLQAECLVSCLHGYLWRMKWEIRSRA